MPLQLTATELKCATRPIKAAKLGAERSDEQANPEANDSLSLRRRLPSSQPVPGSLGLDELTARAHAGTRRVACPPNGCCQPVSAGRWWLCGHENQGFGSGLRQAQVSAPV